jgi:Ca-activated chloride channel family protein
MPLDEATLKGIATTTGGKYYSAQNAGELRQIYGSIAKEHRLAQHYTDVTFVLAGIGMLFLLAAVTLGAVWLGRLP